MKIGFWFGKKKSEPETSKADDWTRIEAALKDLARPCWLPILADGDGAPAGSKFSGIPLLGPGEEWPECPNCGNPMQLFLQLNSSDLPEEFGRPWGEGILQFFYCTNQDPLCEVDCEAYLPFASSMVLRVVPAAMPLGWQRPSPVPDAFPARRIAGWTRKVDYPNWEECRELGREMSDEDEDLAGERGYPLNGEKLGGWPHWVQGIEYPECPECRTRMTLLFQIDSEQALPYMFGDCGIGHITHCPKHPQILAFGWACS